MQAMSINRIFEALAARLLPGPGTPYLTGGALRDLLLGRPPRDVDLLVEGDAGAQRFALESLEALSGMKAVLFDRREPVTWRVVLDGVIVDMSGCAPDGVATALLRRDFTINAMAAPLRSIGAALVRAGVPEGAPGPGAAADPPIAAVLRRALIDPLGGQSDMASRLLRASSRRALEEDPLRMLRAVRLAITLEGFRLEDSLPARIRALARRVTEAAAERLGAELTLVLEASRAGSAFRLMDDLGLLDRLLPELIPLRTLEQPRRYHDHDAREHTLRALEEAEALSGGGAPFDLAPLDREGSVILKWAALLHDVGKAASATRDEKGTPRFHGHEEISASLAGQALRRLRIPTRVSEPVTALIRWHLRPGALASSNAGDRPILRLARLAGDQLPLLVLLALADRRAAGGEDPIAREAALTAMGRRALALRAEVSAIAQSPPLLDGREVMDLLGLEPGPRVGSILRWIDRLRTERRIHTRDEAVELLRSLPPPRLRD